MTHQTRFGVLPYTLFIKLYDHRIKVKPHDHNNSTDFYYACCNQLADASLLVVVLTNFLLTLLAYRKNS